MKNLFLIFFCLFLTDCLLAKPDGTITVEWISIPKRKMPKLRVEFSNTVKDPFFVPVYKGKPILLLDYWQDDIGLVLIEESQFHVLRGGFVEIKTIPVKLGEKISYELDLTDFVIKSGPNEDTKQWQESLPNADILRVVARLGLGSTDIASNYAIFDFTRQAGNPTGSSR